MNINKQTMECETEQFLEVLFSLEEVEKISIKDIPVTSPADIAGRKAGLAECYHDNLSDVDINVWARLNPKDFKRATPVYKTFFPRLQLEDRVFGIVFQERDSTRENREGMRIVLKSGFRMDVTCHIRCDASAIPLPESDLRMEENTENTGLDLDQANAFWFCAIQALAKLLRRDYLIGDHLSYMLLMEGLVLQMINRDNTYHTNFHRYGYAEELMYQTVDLAEYQDYIIHSDKTYEHIAENLVRAVVSYDELASAASSRYEKRCSLFFAIWDCYLTGI